MHLNGPNRLLPSIPFLVCFLLLSAYSDRAVDGQEPASQLPRPTPMTRPELKQMIESVKQRTPRIPLPELTQADREALGDQVDSYESRLRYHFIRGIEPNRPTQPPPSTSSGSGGSTPRGREQDPKFSLDNAFKIELFWIASRLNNCQYCIGHQETKLLAAGRTEDQIAALDGHWLSLDEKQQIAFRFCQKLTREPYRLDDRDIESLKVHFTDLQILEMILSVSGNNWINRWKEGVAVPQRQDEGGYSRLASDLAKGSDSAAPSLPRGSYLTPTSPLYQNLTSKLMPAPSDTHLAQQAPASKNLRALSREEVLQKIEHTRGRLCRMPLVDAEETGRVFPDLLKESQVPNYARLLAHFPSAGKARLETIRSAETGGDLTPLLKAQLSWIVARQDGAWYALGRAYDKMRALGQSNDQIFMLDTDWKTFPSKERSLFTIAKKLGASPVALTDFQVAEGLEAAGARDVVQTVSYVAAQASFDRLTEAVGLPLETAMAK